MENKGRSFVNSAIFNFMKILEVKNLTIPDVKSSASENFSDQRGYFTETFRKSDVV